MEKVLSKYINTGSKVPETELRDNVTKAFVSMGHEIVTAEVKYLGRFAAKRAKGMLRHHYLMRVHLRLNPKVKAP